MAGCECDTWRKITKPRKTRKEEELTAGIKIEYYDVEGGIPSWIMASRDGWFFIRYCPWCGSELAVPKSGSKLTKEAGDAE